jgi:hypothetical protein
MAPAHRAGGQLPPQNRPVAAFGQVAMGRARNSFAREHPDLARFSGQGLVSIVNRKHAVAESIPLRCY